MLSDIEGVVEIYLSVEIFKYKHCNVTIISVYDILKPCFHYPS